MARMWTPRRERIGIEVFAYMTAEEGGFWFFSDYKRRLGLNDKNIERILKNGLPISSRVCLECLGRISDRDSVNEAGFVSRCAILDGAQEHRLPLPAWFSNPPDELWNKLALGVRGTGSGARLHYWIEPPRWKDPDATGKIHGIVRPHPDLLILRHIPLAYYAAQEFWSRRVLEWRPMCEWLLKMISKDLEWCGATAEEMDGWWDSMWAEHGDDTPSVTTLRH